MKGTALVIRAIVLMVLCCPAWAEMGQARPLVGAIRWDAWHGDQGVPGRAVQASLGPRQWHYRLPFYARVEAEDRVVIDGSSQDVVDKEIEYAQRAGLDYWAFVTYAANDPMSLGLKRYLASEKRKALRFCLIVECSRLREAGFVDRMVSLMGETGYLTVLDNRPVLYLGFINEDKVRGGWGSVESFRRTLDGLRDGVRAKGLGDPYIVIMDFNPAAGRRWLDATGAQALSNYAAQGGDERAPYAKLAEHAERFWDRCGETGAQVVPIIMAGWDRRPRVDRPVPWEKSQKGGVGREKYYEAPTPDELAGHAGRALNWLRENRASAQAQLAIIYAWNENDEGGWIVPTLSEGSARLDALGRVLSRRAGAEGGRVIQPN